jgi:hypothetical protein
MAWHASFRLTTHSWQGNITTQKAQASGALLLGSQRLCCQGNSHQGPHQHHQ